MRLHGIKCTGKVNEHKPGARLPGFSRCMYTYCIINSSVSPIGKLLVLQGEGHCSGRLAILGHKAYDRRLPEVRYSMLL